MAVNNISTKFSYKALNEIKIGSEFAEIVIRSKVGEFQANAMIDLESIELVKDKKWHLTSHGYIACKGKKGTFYLHRLVMNEFGLSHIDHKDGNKLDNRKSNLRLCSMSSNIANTKVRKNSKTGVKGVHPFKGGQKFAAQITKNGKTFHLGVFDSVIKAKAVYDQKAIELFGEFARI
jgi:hypothetical protein